jgi:hypothetical protein
MWCVHCHAGSSERDPSGKNRGPHFHLRFVSAFWGRHAGLPTGSLSHPIAANCVAPTPDHDADALYLPIAISLGWDDSPQVDSLVSPVFVAALLPESFPLFALPAATSALANWPAISLQACPIYLRALTLLI